jgi:hypothetical protein
VDVHLIPDTAGGFVAFLGSHAASESHEILLYHVTRADIQDLGTGCSDAGISLNKILDRQRGCTLFSDNMDASDQSRCTATLSRFVFR